ncbi:MULTISPECIES: LysR family transcriptional regulator [Alphaproteobacteria]|nr:MULTISPECIES: LysR family transcriptional regulator [Alphaproteobacteria]
MNFTWDDLQFFLAVARTGQLSTAARQLRSSHATVSRRIDRLEFALKVKLFERNPRGYVLTTMGQRFVETAEKIEQETERLQADLAGGAVGQRGVVRLSAPEGFSNFFFTHALPDFTARHASISLELVTIQQIMALSRKEADVAVVLDPPKGGPYFTEKLTDYHLKIYATGDYLARRGEPKARDELLQHAFIGYIQDMIFAPGLDYLGDIHPRIRPHFQSSSIFAQLTATRSGLGLCVLPIFIAERYPELQVVLEDEIDLCRHYWIACHHDLRQVARVRTVIEFLRGVVSANAAAFTGRPELGRPASQTVR